MDIILLILLQLATSDITCNTALYETTQACGKVVDSDTTYYINMSPFLDCPEKDTYCNLTPDDDGLMLCEARLADGQACSDDTECISLMCSFEKCISTLIAEGEDCDSPF